MPARFSPGSTTVHSSARRRHGEAGGWSDRRGPVDGATGGGAVDGAAGGGPVDGAAGDGRGGAGSRLTSLGRGMPTRCNRGAVAIRTAGRSRQVRSPAFPTILL